MKFKDKEFRRLYLTLLAVAVFSLVVWFAGSRAIQQSDATYAHLEKKLDDTIAQSERQAREIPLGIDVALAKTAAEMEPEQRQADVTFLLKLLKDASAAHYLAQALEKPSPFDDRSLVPKSQQVKNDEEFYWMIKKSLQENPDPFTRLLSPWQVMDLARAQRLGPYDERTVRTMLFREPWLGPSCTAWMQKLNDYPKRDPQKPILNDNIKITLSADHSYAVLKISNFEEEMLAFDQQHLEDFFAQLSKNPVQKLIIDLRQAAWSDSDRMAKTLLSYLVQKPSQELFRSAAVLDPRTKPYLFDPLNAYTTQLGAKNLDPRLQATGKTFYFLEETLTASKNPLAIAPGTHVSILTSSKTQKSAEKVAIFCKRQQIATLIGEPCAGRPLLMDPILVPLPQSVLLVQINPEIPLSADGKILAPQAPDEAVTAPQALERAIAIPLS